MPRTIGISPEQIILNGSNMAATNILACMKIKRIVIETTLIA
jgi:hypothetical protein